METSTKVQIPERLLISTEQFLLNISEPLDPLLGLTLTGLVKQLVNISYLMGHADGKRNVPGD